MRGAWRIGFVAALLVGIGGCTGRVETGRDGIVVTTSILGDAVRALVGSDVPVVVLMGAGVDPHLYKPTPSDVELLQRARCVVAHGLRLEGRMEDVLRALARRKPVLFAAEVLPAEALRRVGPEQYDPHVWFDVRLWKEVVMRLGDTLAVLFPELGQRWRERARRYGERLDTLDAWIRQQVERIPREQRLLVTVHDAFAYFGRAYGLETRALQGISTAAEFGLRDMVQVAELLVERRVRAIFAETTVPVRLVENVARMAQLRGFAVQVAGPLYSDALGAPGSGAETYEGMMRSNVRQIVRGLAGEELP